MGHGLGDQGCLQNIPCRVQILGGLLNIKRCYIMSDIYFHDVKKDKQLLNVIEFIKNELIKSDASCSKFILKYKSLKSMPNII